MKGLVLKDFYLSKKYLLLGVFAYIILVIFSYIFRFAFIYGNLVNYQENVGFVDEFFTVVQGATLLMFAVSAVTEPVYSDLADGFNRFTAASPVNSKNLVGAKFLEAGVLFVNALAWNSIASLVYGGKFGYDNVKTGYLIFLVIALYAVVVFAIQMPLIYRYRNKNAVVSRNFIFCGVIIYLTFGMLVMTGQVDMENGTVGEEMGEFLGMCADNIVAVSVIFVAAVAVIMAAAYRVTLYFYGKWQVKSV